MTERLWGRRRLLAIVVSVLLLAIIVFAQVKDSQLTRVTTVADADLSVVTINLSGTPLTRGVLISNLFTGRTLPAIASLGIRSSGAAFDLRIASSEVLTANRALSITLNDAARSLTIAGDAVVAGTNTGDQSAISGNAGTATALQTARTINGTSFNGTANITVTAAAGTLTGTTLNATVVSSSLTSVGTIATGVWNGTAIAVANGGTGITSFGTGVATWLGTPSSANLRAALTDENGTGVALFDGATTPTFTTGIQIGGAAASRKMLVGNGTNFVPSTETWAVPGTSGNVLTSDGTNWTSAAPAGGGGGTTINSTDSVIPYRLNSTTFANSPITVSIPGSMVDGLTVTGAATANPATVTIAATGSDSNIHTVIAAKGTGSLKLQAGAQDVLTLASDSKVTIFGGGLVIDPFAPTLQIGTSWVLHWGSDGSLSRSGSGVLQIGTGNTANASGSLSLTNLITAATSSTGTAVIIDGSNVLRPLTSSLRYKTNVRDWQANDGTISAFLSLHPIEFQHKENNVGDEIGFSAEGLAAINPELVNFKDGLPYSIREHAVLAYLQQIVKRQQEEIDSLKAKVR